MATTKALENITVLVTRPEPQASQLAGLIQNAGAKALKFPAIRIDGIANRETALKQLGNINQCDWLIFISANAVNYAFELLGSSAPIPHTTRMAAIGTATKTALEHHGYTAALAPEAKSDSEALLSLDALQNLKGKRCMIIRGEGGREKLAEELRNRGATVLYCEVYRRLCPDRIPTTLLEQWKQGAIDFIIVTSNEALNNLISLLDRDGLKQLALTPVITVSDRIAKTAQKQGIKRTIVSKQPYNETLIETLIESIHHREGGHHATRSEL